MERIINWEQWRIITVSAVSPILGYLTLLFNKFLNSSKLWEKLQKKSIAATEATMTTL